RAVLLPDEALAALPHLLAPVPVFDPPDLSALIDPSVASHGLLLLALAGGGEDRLPGEARCRDPLRCGRALDRRKLRPLQEHLEPHAIRELGGPPHRGLP